MLIQSNETYKLEAVVQWLDHDQVHLKLIQHNLNKRGWEISTTNFFLEPKQLAKLSDYIDSTIAR